jgi:ABC-2 type transport system permease protein
MRSFGILLLKELRELLTWQILVPIALVSVLFLGLGSILANEQERTRQNLRVAVADYDNTPTSALVTETLRKANFTVIPGPTDIASNLPSFAAQERVQAAIAIPQGFGAGIQRGEQQELATYSFLTNLSVIGNQSSFILSQAITAVNTYLTAEAISTKTGLNVTATLQPITTRATVFIGERNAQVEPAVLIAFLSQQNTFIPIILFLVITFAAQMIATAIASEKESKTLETLLTMPVPRLAIVTSKMLAAGIVSLVMSGAYLFGLQRYMNGLGVSSLGGSDQGLDQAVLAKLGLQLQGSDMAYVAGMIFLAILVALAMALILGTFAEDIKGVQGLLTPLMMLLIIPYILTLVLDIQSASPLIRSVVQAIPFTHAFQAVPNVYLDRIPALIGGLAYLGGLLIILSLIAARIFTTDRIITMKLSFKKS